MICVRCGHDSKAKERMGHMCPNCNKPFAFQPGEKFTDRAFATAIEAVSASGHLRWNLSNLYYELCRRLEKRGKLRRKIAAVALALVLSALALIFAGTFIIRISDSQWGIAAFFAVGTAAFGYLALPAWKNVIRPSGKRFVAITWEAFEQLWQRWLAVHDSPQGLIVRRESKLPQRAAESDIGDYSFDRAVICDRASTVDLLLANNFHFENNCAVLAITGYPAGPFETVRAMLKRNPRLQVFALHDATAEGCAMANRLARDPAWFHGGVPVTDVGLRPRHSPPFQGLLLRADSAPVPPGQGISEEEATWLSQGKLEIAAIRPEQVLKRLYRALNNKPDDGDGGTSSSIVIYDNYSFAADASDSDGGADSFG
jgi:hypothetical protein